MLRAILSQTLIGAIFYGIIYLFNAPHWACMMTAIICALLIELIMMVKNK